MTDKTTDKSKRVVFHRAQLQYLESIFGTYSDLGRSITSDSNITELNRLSGRQDVIDHIRSLVGVL